LARVVVLAIDGLEYNLVDRWGMKTYMQQDYGKHDVKSAVRHGDPLYTPLIWAAFLLGEPAYKYGFDYKYIEEQKVEHSYGPILRLLYRAKVAVLGSRDTGLRKLLARLGLYRVDRVRLEAERIETLPPEVLEKTFVYEAKRRGLKVVYNTFPGLPGDRFARERASLFQLFDAPFEERKAKLDELYKGTEEDVERLLGELGGSDLVLYYTPVIDLAHHMFYRPGNRRAMLALRRYYNLVARQVERFQAKAGPDDLILIVSDHGYDPRIHEHSDYGFWSSNRRLPRRPERITEFRGIIEEALYGGLPASPPA